MQTQMRPPLKRLIFTAFFAVLLSDIWSHAEDKRAPAPTFSEADTQGIFFDSVTDAIQGSRPALSSLRATKDKVAAKETPENSGSDAAAGTWDILISAASIEDEIKRRKLHFDSVVTKPGPFKSGGYEEARLDLMVMSSLFAIITEYKSDIRWRRDAPAARDLMGRTAFNCNAGTTQVFNEARARKDDLQDLMSGTGLRGRKAEEGNDWASIVDRSPLMEYAEELKELLREASSDADAIKSEPANVKRPAELIAALGRILTQEGLDESDDEDYVAFCKQMTEAASSVTKALEIEDYDAVRKAVGAVTQSCDACHEQYR